MFACFYSHEFDWLGQSCMPSPELHKILRAMAILPLGKPSHREASFQARSGEQTWRENSASLPFCHCECCKAQTVLRAHREVAVFLHSFECEAMKSCGSCFLLSAAVSFPRGRRRCSPELLLFTADWWWAVPGMQTPFWRQTPAVICLSMGELGTVSHIEIFLRDKQSFTTQLGIGRVTTSRNTQLTGGFSHHQQHYI